MARIYDPYVFHCTVAVVNPAVLAREQKRQVDVAKLPPVVQLRWLVRPSIGVPPRPFVVWRRESSEKLQGLEYAELPGDGFVSQVLFEPMVTLEVDVDPFAPGATVLLSGYVDAPQVESLAAATTQTPPGPTTLRIRGSGIRQFVVTGGTVTAVRGESVRDALAGEWKPVELVGLPVDGSWDGSTYPTDEQGLVTAPQPPAEAARQRMVRGLAPFGWWPVTAANCTVPAWQPPDPARYVAEVQAGALEQSRPLFGPGVAPNAQDAIRPVTAVPGPTSRGATAAGDSTTTVPLLATLLVGPGNDSAAALALGFGTAYPVSDLGDVGAEPSAADLMVTAPYPNGVADDGNDVEYAVVLPWPTALQHPPGPPAGLVAERAGLLLPQTDTARWTETIRLAFARVRPSVALERPTVGALARYPSAPGPADLALEPDLDAGGWRPLLLAARPADAGQVALVDSVATELPTDLSPRTLGHAVAVADVYGLWSPWSDVAFTSSAPPYPIPQVVSAQAIPTYAGSAACPTTVSVDVVVDWQTRTPSAVELRLASCPVGYAGAGLPAGVGPFGVPAGCALRAITLAVGGAELLSPSTDVTVHYLTADGAREVSPSDPDFPDSTKSATGDSRRYRITIQDWTLAFGATSHYAFAVWARELTTVPGAPWGDVAAQPALCYAGSPIPPVVTFVAPPTVPLGSMPDAENRSHVTVDTSGVVGAVSVSVWSVAESRLRTAAGLAPQADPATTLPDRYAALQNAYDTLAGSAQRAAFTRYGTYPAGTPGVDVALSRGSREITLFAVTAVNAAGVESGWPTSHSGLQAAAAPAVVAPTMPAMSASFGSTAGTFSVTMTARCALPIARFELYTTRVGPAAADVATMGPPTQVVPVSPGVPDPTDPPPGPAVTVTIGGLDAGSDWRPLRLRAVAVAIDRDDETGSYGARSPASPVAVLASPPATAPDLSALTVHGWGTDGTGVRVAFSSGLPLDVGTLAVSARTAGTSIFSGGGPLPTLPRVDLPASSPPPGASTGVLVRGAASGGATPYEAWFVRAGEGDAVDVEVVLRDALGRVSVRDAAVAGGAIDPPEITVLTSRTAAPYLLAQWTTDTPPDDGTGPCVLTIVGASSRFFPPLGRRLSVPKHAAADAALGPVRFPFPPPRITVSATFPMPAIRDASVSPLQPVDVDVVRVVTDGFTSYVAAVRVPAPGSMTLSIATPGGQVGSARIPY